MTLKIVARFRPGCTFVPAAFLAQCFIYRSPRPAFSGVYTKKPAADPGMQSMTAMAAANKDVGGQPWRIGRYKTEAPDQAGLVLQAT